MQEMRVYIIAYIVFYVIAMISGILNYVFTSLSIYTIAKRRLISKPWLAWIPIANAWAMGSIADEYDAKMGINRKWRVVLLTLSLIFIAVFLIFYILLVVSIVTFAYSFAFAEPTANDVIGFMIPIMISSIATALVSVALSACSYICMFTIYESTVPHKALKYFLLSLLVPYANVICLFLCRNQGYSNTPVNPYVQQPYYPQNNQY